MCCAPTHYSSCLLQKAPGWAQVLLLYSVPHVYKAWHLCFGSFSKDMSCQALSSSTHQHHGFTHVVYGYEGTATQGTEASL